MTLAAQWQRHADRELPLDASHAQVIRMRRVWYYEQMLRLKAAPQTTESAALLAEAIGFGRAIGTAAESAAA